MECWKNSWLKTEDQRYVHKSKYIANKSQQLLYVISSHANIIVVISLQTYNGQQSVISVYYTLERRVSN